MSAMELVQPHSRMTFLEKKWKDTFLGTLSPSPDLTFDGDFLTIAQGAGESERLGRRIIVRSINIRGVLSLPAQNGATVPPTGDVLRSMLLLDKQCNGAVPSNDDVLAQTNGGERVYSFRNVASAERFEILNEQFNSINYRGGIGIAADQDWSGQREVFSVYVKCRIPIEYSGATGAVTERTTNNIVFGGITLASDCDLLFVNVRVRYTDE